MDNDRTELADSLDCREKSFGRWRDVLSSSAIAWHYFHRPGVLGLLGLPPVSNSSIELAVDPPDRKSQAGGNGTKK